MWKEQITSVGIPRFESVTDVEGPLGLRVASDPAQVLVVFSIALAIDAIEEQEIVAWARARTYLDENTPEWVWDVLDPDISVKEAIQKRQPVDAIQNQAVYMLAVIEKAVEEKRIRVAQVLPHIEHLKWTGAFGVNVMDPVVDSSIRFQTALESLLDCWNRIKVLQSNTKKSDHPLLPELEQRFQHLMNVRRKTSHLSSHLK